MAFRHFRIGILRSVVLYSVVAMSSFGCAGKNHSAFKEPSIRGFKSSKELHLKQQAKAAATGAVKPLPEMTCQEHERLGDIYFGRGDLAMAFAEYTEALFLDPENVTVFYKKGLMLVLGNMNEDALSEFENALERDPKHAQSYEGMGLAYFQMQKYEQAEYNFQKATQFDQNLWKAHNFLGIIYDHKGEHKKAGLEYEAAIALTQKKAVIYNNMGMSFFWANDYTNAVNAFYRAVSLGQEDQRIYNNLGLALASLGQYQEALEAFRKGGDEAQAYNNLGCVYLKRGEYEKALEAFERALKLRPTFYNRANDNFRKAKFGRDQKEPDRGRVQKTNHSLEPLYGLCKVVKNSNVREAPDKTAKRIAWLPKGQRVVTVGKVPETNWILIAKDGKLLGYIYGGLLETAEHPKVSGKT
jgi:Flp pilus assembly protein TadD